MPEATSQPSERAARSARRRFLALLAVPFLRVGRWFSHAPRAIQIGVVLVAVGALAGGTYYGQSYLAKRAREREVAAGWREFEEAGRSADVPAMHTALDRVLAASPHDATATARKAALAAGSADADDSDLAVVLVSHHMRQNRLAEAAREARKVLARYPKHWRALCVLAHYAVHVNRDADEARRWLEALPNPDDPGVRVDVGGLLHAVQLSRQLARDPAPFRRLIVYRVLPLLRGAAADSAPPVAKAQLIECYLEPFADPANLTELAGYWGVVSRLADAAAAGAQEAGDVVTLVRLGVLGERMRAALGLFREHRHVTDDRFVAFTKEVDDRTRRVWSAVRQKEPARPEPYGGLAFLAVREGNYRQALETLLEGLAACGDRPELLDLLMRLAAATGNAEPAFKMMWGAAEKAGTDPVKWCLAATAALATGRHHREALAACENARKHAPDHPWARRIQVRVWLDTGETAKALELLRSFGEPALRTDPRLVRLYARALVEAGQAADGEQFASELEKAELGRPVPVLGVSYLRGLFDAKPDLARARRVADRANRLLANWPDDPGACRVLADALFRQSELAALPWNADAARGALRAFDRLPSADKTEPGVVTSVAALQLKALNDPAAASRTVAPFRDPANAALLTPVQREVMGAVSIATGKPDEAIAMLERAVRDPNATAGCWVQLALAYHAKGRAVDARAALEKAATFPNRSTREEAERLSAAGTLRVP
jgi:predicted Zn-dependent protease